MYRKMIAVCSQINTKHINTVCGQNVAFLLRSALRYTKQALGTEGLKTILLHEVKPNHELTNSSRNDAPANTRQSR